MSSVAEELAAWVLLPAVLYATALGIGLLLERVARTRLPNPLLAPAGLCAAIVVVMPIYKVGLHGWVPAGALIVLAVAGFVLARADLRSRANPGVAALVALAIYLAYVSPAAFSGGWTWAGYNFVNDTATQVLLAEHVKDHGAGGTDFPQLAGKPFAATTHDLFVETYFDSNYPLGAHELLGALSTITGTPPEVIYQGLLATLAALGAMALFALALRSGLSRWAAALVAVLAAFSNLLYQYALQGNIKEVAMFAGFATLAALARELLASDRPVGIAALASLAAAACVGVFSAAALPYIGLTAVVLVAGWLMTRRERADPLPFGRVVAAALATFAVAGLTPMLGVVGFSDTASGVYGGASEEMGHLLRPLPLVQSTGVWLAGNYRGPIEDDLPSTVTTVVQWGIVAALVLGAVLLLRRREPGPLLYFLPAALTAVIFVPRLSPYADAKIYVALTSTILFLAAFALLALRGRLRWLGWIAALALGGALAVSNAWAYKDVKLAPIERMEALEDVGERLDGQGPVLFVEFEEFAKYFARDADLNVAFEALTPRQVELRDPRAFYGNHFDLDEMTLDYVEAFPTIVQRRAPDASRPPADYRRVYTNDWYVVWRRDGDRRVREHLPLQDLHQPAQVPRCGDVRDLAARARLGEWVVAAERPELEQFDVRNATDRSPGWPPDAVPGTATASTQGGARGGHVDLDGGRYRIWLRGSFSRPVQAIVDGRVVGRARDVNTPGGWYPVTTLDLPAGRHTTAVFRPGGNFAPGTNWFGIVGPLAFERVDGPRAGLRWVRPADARTLCGKRWDWIEVARR